MNTLLPRVAIWLVPERQVRARLQEQVRALAERFDTVAFLPHVTLYSCFRSSQQSEIHLVSRLAKDIPEIALQIKTLACAGKLTRALTITFSDNQELERLFRQLREGCSAPSNYIYPESPPEPVVPGVAPPGERDPAGRGHP